MIDLILALALAQPCLAPRVATPTHKHAHRVAIPAQTCVAPPVPMCFRDPVLDPTEVILPPLQTYPIDTLTTEEVPNASADTLLLVSTGGYVLGGISSGGPSSFVPPGNPRDPPLARAPEISGAGAAGALTLLFCAIAITKRTMS